MPEERFVADGYKRLTESSEFQAAQEAVVAAAQLRYAELMAEAGVFRRLVLHLRMRREIAQELDRLAPPDALYLRTS